MANPKFSVAIQSDGYQKLINNTLGDKEVARKFVADISSVVSSNYALSKCDAGSILSAGLMAQSLNLPLSNSLGFAYVVPYGGKDGYKAQFQIGWKGYVQLAIRSGQYQNLGCYEVHDGEIKTVDVLTREPELLIPTPETFNQPVIGYVAYFKLNNGFKKVLYWTKEQCEAHAKKYSKSYATGNWQTNFDGMALKTVVKQLLSKWGVMSVDLQKAIEADQAVINEDGTYEYVDSGHANEEIANREKTNITNSIVDEEDLDNPF